MVPESLETPGIGGKASSVGKLLCSTMRFSFLAIVLITVLQIPACDLTGGSAQVQKSAEAQLRQYFPRAHAIVSPQQGTILAVTCTQGLGKPVIEEIAKYLESKRGIQRLEQARRLPVKFSPYRFVVLEFDEYCIRLDTDTKQHLILPADPLRYKRVCGTDTPRASVNR